ncbi:MAG: HAD family hydrolase [Firmicutes bacterium HGW-Firmicutes-16]|nr:MAG: HAD family hydrolase [Firmicutes bacterium HGW-Firmicutes-16]
MSKYNTIIWDMDGTLLDTLDDLTDSVNAAMTEFHLPVRTRDEIRSFIGNGINRLLGLSIPGGKQNPQFEEILSFFKICYAKNSSNKTKPYIGLDKVLPELKSGGYRMAIVSNKIDTAVKALSEQFFKNLMDAAIGNSENLRRKPSPDEVFEALRILGAEKESAVYIGDTEVDIETAKNAGIDCISVSWGYRDRQELLAHGARAIVDTPEELVELLK